MRAAVVGGGVVGLFTARYLQEAGAEVTLFESGPLGAGSVHAAGIIEPATAYRTNTLAFLRRVWRYWWDGTCVYRSADLRWWAESLRQLERAPPAGFEPALAELAETSLAEYRRLAGERNDFGYEERGLTEQFDDPRHYAQERALALARREQVPVDVRDDGATGSLFFPEAGWLGTERFVDRMRRDLAACRVLRRSVQGVALDGTVDADGERSSFEAVVVAAGTGCRRLGVPLTGVRGYGWHVRSPARPPVATIHVDRGLAIVPLDGELKITGGWDFDLSDDPARSRRVYRSLQEVVPVEAVVSAQQGSRPCTPDGLPTVGRAGRVVVATGGFRLGWSFAPALGRHAAGLALGTESNQPFLARFCGRLHDGRLEPAPRNEIGPGR